MPLELPPDYNKDAPVEPAPQPIIKMKLVTETRIEEFVVEVVLEEEGQEPHYAPMRLRRLNTTERNGDVTKQFMVYLMLPIPLSDGRVINRDGWFPLPAQATTVKEAVTYIPAISDNAYTTILEETKAELERQKQAAKAAAHKIQIPTAAEASVVKDAMEQAKTIPMVRKGHMNL